MGVCVCVCVCVGGGGVVLVRVRDIIHALRKNLTCKTWYDSGGVCQFFPTILFWDVIDFDGLFHSIASFYCDDHSRTFSKTRFKNPVTNSTTHASVLYESYVVAYGNRIVQIRLPNH